MAQQDDALLFFWFLGAVVPLKRLSQTVGRWGNDSQFYEKPFTVNTVCRSRATLPTKSTHLNELSQLFFLLLRKYNITIPRIQC